MYFSHARFCLNFESALVQVFKAFRYNYIFVFLAHLNSSNFFNLKVEVKRLFKRNTRYVEGVFHF